MSQSQDMDAIDAFFAKQTPKNANAAAIKTAWRPWYTSLGIVARNFDSAILTEAKSRRDAFNRAQAGVIAPAPAAKPAANVLVAKARPTIKKTRPKYSANSPEFTATKEWQRFLGGLVIDGDFYTASHDATKKWQKANGLKDDGVVGPMTWAKAVEVSKRVMNQPASPAVAAVQAAQGVAVANANKPPTTPTAVQAAASQAAKQASAERATAPAPIRAPTTKAPVPKPVKSVEAVAKEAAKLAAKPTASPPTMLAGIQAPNLDTLKATVLEMHEKTPMWLKITTGGLAALSAYLGIKAFNKKAA